jgi:hypothetical protein
LTPGSPTNPTIQQGAVQKVAEVQRIQFGVGIGIGIVSHLAMAEIVIKSFSM